MLVRLDVPPETVEPPQPSELGQKLLLAFLTGVVSAAGAALFNALIQPARRRR